MCRYAFKTYKTHFVCFDCRKSFKQHPTEDLIIRDGLWEHYQALFLQANKEKAEAYRALHPEFLALIESKYLNRTYPCPQCAKTMANVGMDFKAPKVEAMKEWEILKGMYKVGHAFQTCGCDGPGFIPQSEPEYVEYLTKRRKQYQKRLESHKEAQSPKEMEQFIYYWSGKLQAVEAELQKIPRANRGFIL